jgi:hypothetical protein
MNRKRSFSGDFNLFPRNFSHIHEHLGSKTMQALGQFFGKRDSRYAGHFLKTGIYNSESGETKKPQKAGNLRIEGVFPTRHTKDRSINTI